MSDVQPIVLHLAPTYAYLDPIGFWNYARHFLTAARSARTDKEFSPVPYYLYCHGLELALKAFVLARGGTQHQLKSKIGHNLDRALRQAESKGLRDLVSLTQGETTQVQRANAYYDDKGFEYFTAHPAVTGYPNLPELTLMDALLDRLLQGIELECAQAINMFNK